MPILFETMEEIASFHSPLNRMELVEDVITRRRDPLTGRWAITTSRLKDKTGIFFGKTDEQLLRTVAEQTREGCFFCPENIEKSTPKYPAHMLSQGRLKVGDAVLIPNLFPLAPIHSVIVLGQQHFRRLDQFTPELLKNGLTAAVRFANTVYQINPAMSYMTVNGNYLFPSGASIVHPHMQLLGGSNPFSAVEELLAACEFYREENETGYFTELIAAERRTRERFITSDGPVHWLTSFAPLGTNEILGICPQYRHLGMLDEVAIKALAGGMSRVLAFYYSEGYSTYTFTIFSSGMDGETDDQDDSFPVFIRMLTRQNVYQNYRNDDYFIQKLLGEELILMSPEELADRMRQHW